MSFGLKVFFSKLYQLFAISTAPCWKSLGSVSMTVTDPFCYIMKTIGSIPYLFETAHSSSKLIADDPLPQNSKIAEQVGSLVIRLEAVW